MAESIEKVIYKLELDGAGYITGVEALANSTKKLNEAQEATNRTLRTNEAALKTNSERLEKARKDLESYAGTNVKYRQQLERDVRSAEKDQAKLTDLVNTNRVAYEKATKAAADFANVSARATAQQQQTTGGKIAPIVPPPGRLPPIPIDITELTDLPDIVNATKDEFEQLRVAIEAVEAQMASLDQESDEFKQLAPIVQQGRNALKQYDDAAKQSSGSTQSLRTQLRLGREELVRLEQAGKGTTKQYFELEKRVAKLTDEFQDQQARIKILASDTKLLDFGKGAITAATAAFQAYTSVSILVGDENEELQKKTMQLFAAMQLLQSLEQLSNLTRREGILSTLGLSGAVKAYEAVIGSATGALKAYRTILLGLGIGAAIYAIVFLVQKYQELQEATKAAGQAQKDNNEINLQASESVAKVRVELSQMQTNVRLAKEGLLDKNTVLKEYNEGLGKVIGSTNDLNEAEQLLIDKGPAFIQLTFMKAQAMAAGELALAEIKKSQAAQFKSVDEFATAGTKVGAIIRNVFRSPVEAAKDAAKEGEKTRQKEITDSEVHAQNLLKIQSDLQAKAAQFAKDNGLIFEPIKTDTNSSKKAVESDFEQRKAVLLEQIAKLANSEFESEVKIRKEFAAKLDKELLSIKRDKTLAPVERTELINLATTLNTGEVEKAIADFNKKVADKRKELNTELNDLQDKYLQDNLNLIQDEFDRRAALIDFNERRELDSAEEATQERLDSLEFDRFLIGEQNYQDAKAEIVAAGEQNALNIIGKFSNQRKDLSAAIFQRSLNELSAVFEEKLLEIDDQATAKIQQQKDLLATGAINYAEFQKNVTEILKNEKELRDKLRLQELNADLTAIRTRLEATDNEEEKVKLKAQERSIRKEINDINSQTTTENPDKERLDTLLTYVNSIGALAQSVVSFWQTANEAESQALDRSISIQEKRVSAAQRIADRGNAQYLKAEEDRLTELNLKRENAARKQLAIDAALQASQILVGITGAIAKIATPGIGIAESIAAMAVIVGSLAAGYGLVKSLQGNQPRLAEGTTYLTRGKNPRGKDTIPAYLNEGEAVIPTDTNKKYHPAIKAIYHGTVPAEDINNFVKNHHKIKSVPIPDYGRIKESAELSVGQDGRMAVAISEQNRLIVENNDLQRQTLRAMKLMSVSASIDRDGVAIMVNEFIEAQAIAKRT